MSHSQDEYGRNYHAAKRAKSQDVYETFKDRLDKGPVDPARREGSAASFKMFCESYGSSAFSLAWSPYHLRAITKIEDAVLSGGMFAFAMPRGSGKTTLCHWATLWAILNGHSPYVVFIGSAAASAKRRLDNLKQDLRFNDLLFEDFPEALAPIRHLEGESRKASGQKYKGEPTGIQWTQNQIVMAAIENAACSEAIIDVTGIDGDIRGRNYQRQTGEIIRPTFAICDDPQTRESAKSLPQCEHREAVISGDIKFLAGPDEPVGVAMPCTVVFQNDLADRMLNRKTHPEWNGERVAMVEKLPSNDKLWEQYAEIRSDSFRQGNKGEDATKFYLENREAMDLGALVTWPERFNKDEASALQHAMNHKIRDEGAFFAECQNQPIQSSEGLVATITAEELAEQTNGIKRGIIPEECQHLTAFIDVSEKILWWAVVAWSNDFTGSVVDYGAFPDQELNYFTLGTVKKTLKRLRVNAGQEAALYGGLEDLCKIILAKEYKTEGGHTKLVDKCAIDSGWGQSTATVYKFCKRSEFRHILTPTKGVGITAAREPLVNPTAKRKDFESVRGQWRKSRTSAGVTLLQYDTNHWKTFTANRLAVSKGDPGSLTLFQQKPFLHRMFSEQMTSEACTRTEGRGRVVDQWSNPPGRDNHFFDCVVGCGVVASTLGCKISSSKPSQVKQSPRSKPRKKKVTYL